MLVTFSTSAYADITMFGDVAIALLKHLGHSGTVPGAILAEDIPASLEKLRSAIPTADQVTGAEEPDTQTKDDGQTAVSLQSRAFPLTQLLEAAAAANASVMWK